MLILKAKKKKLHGKLRKGGQNGILAKFRGVIV
jgi:hypothetical protein